MHQRRYIKDEKYTKEKVHYYTTVSAVEKTLRHEYWEILQVKTRILCNWTLSMLNLSTSNWGFPTTLGALITETVV